MWVQCDAVIHQHNELIKNQRNSSGWIHPIVPMSHFNPGHGAIGIKLLCLPCWKTQCPDVVYDSAFSLVYPT